MILLMQIITLILICICTLVVYKKLLVGHHKISCNTVMLATMTFSTANGLIMGNVLSLTQSFSLNCILSMIIGIGTGLIFGVIYNIMTTIEGIVGGVMGGLMGAMLGAMLEQAYIYIITAILVAVIIAITILLIKHIQQEIIVDTDDVKLPIMQAGILKLGVGFFVGSIVLFSGILLGTNLPLDDDQSNKIETDHSHH